MKQQQALSYLRHHRETTPADAEKPLEAIYENPVHFRGFIENQMVKMLSLGREEMTNGMMTEVAFSRKRLRTAKRSLKSIELVGIQERLEEFAQELERRWGWRLGPPVYAIGSEPVDVPASFRARIAEDNRLDVELYEFARGLVESRHRAR